MAGPETGQGGATGAGVGERPAGRASDQSIGDLARQLSEQTSTLVRQEMELARAELTQKGKQAGIGVGMFGGAGTFVFYAIGALTAAAILGLAEAVAGWLAALIIGVLYLAIAAVLALLGKSKVEQATPPVPERAVESTKEDVEWAKTSAKSARQ